MHGVCVGEATVCVTVGVCEHTQYDGREYGSSAGGVVVRYMCGVFRVHVM